MKLQESLSSLIGIAPLEANQEGQLRGGFALMSADGSGPAGQSNTNCNCNCGCNEVGCASNANCGCNACKTNANCNCNCLAVTTAPPSPTTPTTPTNSTGGAIHISGFFTF